MGVWLATVALRAMYIPWPDPLAWGLAFPGLFFVASAHRSRKAAVMAVVLLTAGFWSKQSTVVVAIAAVTWLLLLCWRGQRSPPLVP